MGLSNPCQLFYAIKFTPWFPTAGFGVFAGRAFNEDEVVMQSSMTLFLPKRLPQDLSLWYYVFGYNETHMALPLDYASLFNHHKTANTYIWLGRNSNMHFRVRGVFQCANHTVLRICTCMNMCVHTCTADACIHKTLSRP